MIGMVSAAVQSSQISVAGPSQSTRAEPVAFLGSTGFQPTEVPRDAAGILSRYDLSQISPREVDALVDALKETGEYDFRDLLMLETRGERFQAHLAASLSEHLGTEIPFDANATMDVKASAEAQLGFARLSGQPTQGWEDFISFLDALKRRTTENSVVAVASTAQLGHVVEAMLLEGAMTA